MSNPALESSVDAPRNAASDSAAAARQALSDDAQRPHAPMSHFNVHRQREGDNTLTHYPNGVEINRGGPALGMEPPPGGSVGTDEQHRTILKDAKGKVVARLDADKTVHVYTKDGEYIEKPNGKIQFKSNEELEGGNLWAKQKTGKVTKDKLEDYGVSTDGKTYKFNNGIEYTPGKDMVSLSSEHPNAQKNEERDAEGRLIKTTYTENGKVLFTRDKDGVHVPTENGVTTINQAGQVKFEKNPPAGLPKVDIIDDKKKEKPITDPFDPRCNNGDPLCGLDLGNSKM